MSLSIQCCTFSIVKSDTTSIHRLTGASGQVLNLAAQQAEL